MREKEFYTEAKRTNEQYMKEIIDMLKTVTDNQQLRWYYLVIKGTLKG